MLNCHTVHKKGEHLAPHRVLAVRTGLRTEGEVATGQFGQSLLLAFSAVSLATMYQWEPYLHAGLRPAHSSQGHMRAGDHTQRPGGLCQKFYWKLNIALW